MKCPTRKVQHTLEYIGIRYVKKKDQTRQRVLREERQEEIGWITTAPSQPIGLHTHVGLHRELFLFSAIASRYGSCFPFNPISSL